MVNLSSIDTSVYGAALAWVSAVILINWLVRLYMNFPARLTSWGGWVVVAVGVIFIRLPEAYGLTDITDWQLTVRTVAYALVLILHAWDWGIYLSLTPQERTEIRNLMLTLKNKEKEKEKNNHE